MAPTPKRHKLAKGDSTLKSGLYPVFRGDTNPSVTGRLN